MDEESRNTTPLADKLRPETLKGVVGQEKITDKGSLLQSLVQKNTPTSLLLWGPPGTGKTTLARILSSAWDAERVELSAVTSGVKDVRAVIEQAKQNQRLQRRTVLFVDEIHRFNKSQQDAFLPHVESGLITLIGATTENPSFEINNALLSRMQVVVLRSLDEQALEKLVSQATSALGVRITKSAKNLVVQMAAGDGRSAINMVEAASRLRVGKEYIRDEHVKQAMQRTNYRFDKDGDMHYDLISAFIKSMRGSHAEASLYYMHRLLEGGEDPLFIARRMVIFASEDVGLAAPYALTMAVAAYEAVERIGLPEAEYALSHAAMALAESPKSRKVADAMSQAKSQVRTFPAAEVPLHLRNAPTSLAKKLGHNKGYKWEADFKPDQGFLPKELQ